MALGLGGFPTYPGIRPEFLESAVRVGVVQSHVPRKGVDPSGARHAEVLRLLVQVGQILVLSIDAQPPPLPHAPVVLHCLTDMQGRALLAVPAPVSAPAPASSFVLVASPAPVSDHAPVSSPSLVSSLFLVLSPDPVF